MTLSLQLPDQAQDVLRNAFGEDLNRAALEALVIEGYRTCKLSRFDVQKLLGFDNRWDTEEWLATHGLHLQYSLEDLDADRQTLEKIRERDRK